MSALALRGHVAAVVVAAVAVGMTETVAAVAAAAGAERLVAVATLPARANRTACRW